jgi:hypothetical protein
VQYNKGRASFNYQGNKEEGRNNQLCIEDQLLQKEEIWTKIQSNCRNL